MNKKETGIQPHLSSKGLRHSKGQNQIFSKLQLTISHFDNVKPTLCSSKFTAYTTVYLIFFHKGDSF